MQGFGGDSLITRNNATIERMFSKNGKVASYLINYDDGWELLAADKRCQIVLAWAPHGRLIVDNMPLAARQWLEDLNLYVIAKSDCQSNSLRGYLTDDEIESFDYWHYINSRDVPFPDWSPENEGFPSGHWELTGTGQSLVSETVNHLVPVHWGQDYPYNIYCPLVEQQYGDLRSPAGCVAVAGAQVLYYFHSFLGVPSTAPTTGSVTGYARPNGDFSQSFGNDSASAWGLMPTQPSVIAMLIGQIGKAIGTNYASYIETRNGVITYIGSGASLSSLASLLSNEYGISSSQSYLVNVSDVNSIIGSINNGSPVLVSASVVPDNNRGGHTFIIDAWKQTRYRYYYNYEWIYDDPANNEIWIVPTEVLYDYSSPINKFFGMNWGWDEDYDDMWFAPLGTWSPSDDAYDGNRHFYYNFSLE